MLISGMSLQRGMSRDVKDPCPSTHHSDFCLLEQRELEGLPYGFSEGICHPKGRSLCRFW